MIKLISTDMDGTLLYEKGNLPKDFFHYNNKKRYFHYLHKLFPINHFHYMRMLFLCRLYLPHAPIFPFYQTACYLVLHDTIYTLLHSQTAVPVPL